MAKNTKPKIAAAAAERRMPPLIHVESVVITPSDDEDKKIVEVTIVHNLTESNMSFEGYTSGSFTIAANGALHLTLTCNPDRTAQFSPF